MLWQNGALGTSGYSSAHQETELAEAAPKATVSADGGGAGGRGAGAGKVSTALMEKLWG